MNESKIIELAMASVGVDTWPWAWERATDLRPLHRSVPLASESVRRGVRNRAQSFGIVLGALMLLFVWALAGCHRKPVYRPSHPERPTSPSFECRPDDTWGECLQRECQRRPRARCL